MADPPPPRARQGARAARVLLAVPLALAWWLAVLAVTMRLGTPAPAALVVLPPVGLLARLPEGVALTDANALGLGLTV